MSLMSPLPLAVQLEPTDAVQLQVGLSISDGRLSVTVAPTASLGPLLLTTMV